METPPPPRLGDHDNQPLDQGPGSEAGEAAAEWHAVLVAADDEERADNWLKARLIVSTGCFSVTDLLQMLRGQIINNAPELPCARGESDLLVGLAARRLPVWPRTMDQPDPEGPFEPARTPPNVLRCPLEQRGDRTVPCSKVQRGLAQLGPDECGDTGAQPGELADQGRRLAYSFRHRHIRPCQIFYEVANHAIRDTFRRLRAARDPVQVPSEGSGPEAALQQVHYLVDSERLSGKDLSQMLEWGIYMMHLGWLPCRDDSQRDQLEYWDRAEHEPIHPGRRRCPLQVRAILGDRTVACAEAQDLLPPESLVRAAKEQDLGWLEDQSGRPADPVAGTADDPVRRLGLRPCQLLGQVLAASMMEVHRRLAEDERRPEEGSRSGAPQAMRAPSRAGRCDS